jgi:hypothetical protein
MRGLVRLFVLLACFGASPALARQKSPPPSRCTDDAYRFCEAVVPDKAKIEVCLRGHMRELSRPCRAEFEQRGKKYRRRYR